MGLQRSCQCHARRMRDGYGGPTSSACPEVDNPSTQREGKGPCADLSQATLQGRGAQTRKRVCIARPACVLHGRCVPRRKQAIDKEQFKKINRATAEHFSSAIYDSNPVDEEFEQAVRAFLGREMQAVLLGQHAL